LTVTQLKAQAFDGSVTGSAVLVPAHPERDHVTVSVRNVASAALEAGAGVKRGASARPGRDTGARGGRRGPARARPPLGVPARAAHRAGRPVPRSARVARRGHHRGRGARRARDARPLPWYRDLARAQARGARAGYGRSGGTASIESDGGARAAGATPRTEPRI